MRSTERESLSGLSLFPKRAPHCGNISRKVTYRIRSPVSRPLRCWEVGVCRKNSGALFQKITYLKRNPFSRPLRYWEVGVCANDTPIGLLSFFPSEVESVGISVRERACVCVCACACVRVLGAMTSIRLFVYELELTLPLVTKQHCLRGHTVCA